MISLFGCVQANQKETPITTPTISVTATPISTPTSAPLPSPSPSPSPAYSYAPVISAENITEVEKLDNFYGDVNSLAISPNGKYLAATFENGTGIIWDISNVKYLREWRDAPKDIFFSKGSLSFNSDSNILATGGTLLELPSKRLIQELQGTVIFNSTNQTFALFDWKNISIWNLSENQPALNLKHDSPGIENIAFSPDGTLLGEALNWGSGEGVNIWRVSDQTLLYSFPPPEHNHPAHFNFLPMHFWLLALIINLLPLAQETSR
jgi:WD40 repeat protein